MFGVGVQDPARLLLVVDDGEVAGHLSGLIEEPTPFCVVRTAVLRSLYVAPRARGLGLGGRLVSEFLTWATARQAAQVEVTAHLANEGALRFYAAHGFTAHRVVLRRHPAGQA